MTTLRKNDELRLHRSRQDSITNGNAVGVDNAKASVTLRLPGAALADNQMRPLPPGFRPGPFDVICARGKIAHAHYGNRKFREKIEKQLETYSKAASKVEKSLIVTNIVDSVRECSSCGGFVKEEGGRWFEVGDHVAREKVGQGMRDLLHTKYRSSHKSKKRRRKVDRCKLNDDVEDFLQTHCKEVMHRLKDISSSPDTKTDDELQSLFNQAQTDLLDTLKKHDLSFISSKPNPSKHSFAGDDSGDDSSEASMKDSGYEREDEAKVEERPNKKRRKNVASETKNMLPSPLLQPSPPQTVVPSATPRRKTKKKKETSPRNPEDEKETKNKSVRAVKNGGDNTSNKRRKYLDHFANGLFYNCKVSSVSNPPVHLEREAVQQKIYISCLPSSNRNAAYGGLLGVDIGIAGVGV